MSAGSEHPGGPARADRPGGRPARPGGSPGRAGTSAADSAGEPWAGRTLAPAPFAGDDGSLSAALGPLLAAGGGVDVAALVAALPGQRLFAPVLAVDATTDARAHGGDAGADMALPSLRAPDGRTALPLFTSTAALAAWDAVARPVPVEARRAALSAVSDGHALLVLDPAGTPGGQQRGVVVPRPAVWALAQDRPWTPAPRDPAVAAAVRAALAPLPGVRDVAVGPGRRAELAVALGLAPGLGPEEVRRTTEVASAALGASEVVAERVDSLEVVLRGA